MKRRIVIAFLITLLSTLSAQDVTISGKVRHANTYAGIAGVNIFVNETNFGTTSQSNGQFILKIGSEFRNNDIIFEHVAFDTLRLSPAQAIENSDFYLQPRIIQLGDITVVAERIAPEISKDIPQSLAIITAQQYEVQGYIDAGDLLKTEQSIQVDEELSGEKTISIRAGNAEDVIILYNGIKMNDSYENRFDLALINLEDLRRVEIIKGSNTALYGSEAFSGVVNFIPKTHQDYTVRFQQKFGTYNSGDWNLQLNHTFSNRLSLSYNVKQGASKREYMETESGSDFLENRINYHTANFVYDFGSEDEAEKGETLSGMFIFSDFDYSDSRYDETLNTSNQLVSLGYQGMIAGLPGFKISGSYQRLEKRQRIPIDDGQLSLDLNNRKGIFHIEKGFSFKQLELLFAAQSEPGILELSEIRDAAATQAGIQSADYETQKNGLVSILKVHTPTGADFMQIADFDLSYRYDWVRYSPDNIVYRDPTNSAVVLDEYKWSAPTVKFSAHISGRQNDYEFNAFMNYGTNIKFPSVFQQISSPRLFDQNSRGLTAELNPEKNRSTEIGIDVLHETNNSAMWEGWQIQFNYFTNFYENKFRTYFIPGIPVAFFDNVVDAGISGVEMMVRTFLLRKKITLEFGLSRYSISEQAAFPFKSDAKQVFDIHIDHAGYSFQFHWFMENSQVGWIRDTESAEFRILSLPDHANIDIHLGKVFEIYKFKLITNISARNLLRDTTQISGIAIRDRRFYVSLGIEY